MRAENIFCKNINNITRYYNHISDIIQTNHFYILFCRKNVYLGEYLSLLGEDYAFPQMMIHKLRGGKPVCSTKAV